MIRSSSYMNCVNLGNGTSLLFSGISLCMDLVPQDYAEKIKENDFSFLLDKEINHLLKRGHLTTLSWQQEYNAFRKQANFILNRNAELMRKQQLYLSFVLTYNCNLACKYCYQNTLSKQSRVPNMSPQMVDDILSRYLWKLFPKTHRSNKMSFILFGGEPFLPSNSETILQILHYARKHHVKISTATNALFIPQVIDLFGQEFGKIQNVQVTLDGDHNYHNSQRVNSSGEPTFDEIILAIRMLKKTSANVLLRVHTHPRQMNSTKKLIKYLNKRKITGGNVQLYFSPLASFRNCSREEMSELQNIFGKVSKNTGYPPSAGLTFIKHLIEMQEEIILPKTQFCSVGNNTVRIVDPLGDIFECYEDAGQRKRRIGSISGNELKFFPLKRIYSNRHLLNMPECLRCSFALFCGGGCPARARSQTGSIFKPYCHQNREFITETLKAYFMAREK